MKDLTRFYKKNDIEYSADGIGNEVWTYKGITIASYVDMPNEVTHVYCYWAIDKHNSWECERGKIRPVLKVNKMYYYYCPDIDGEPLSECCKCNVPWGDFENPYKDIEKFKEKLLQSVNLLKGRLQVLKGKRTMFNKHKNSKLSNEISINDFNIDWNRIFGNGRTDAHVKLANGNVLPCHKLENGLIYVIDSDNIYMRYTTIKHKREWSSYITIPKADFIKIAEKEFFME